MKARGAMGAVALALSGMLALSTSAMAAPGDGGGGGGPGDGGGSDTGSLYSDLVIALRDANGAPILKKYVVPATETEAATTEYCVQPVSYEPVAGVPSTTNLADGQTVWVIPLQGEWLSSPPDPLPVAEIEACDPQPQYAAFVSEVELERLNMARTDESVIEQKISDVQTKLRFADLIALESTGRITYDGTTIDASPENAAIYQSLMQTGTIPGLHPAEVSGPPALIGPASSANSQFDAWELAAMAIGAAASKSTPVNVDTVEYYNRVIGLPDFTSLWSDVDFVQPADPDNPGSALASGEKFVDYSGFSYTRSQTFRGSVTWLDVPSLTWKVSRITDVVPFTHPELTNETLTGVRAFAQFADDVRALCNYIPDNTFIPGYYMDVPGMDTTDAQLKAIHDPAVDLGTLPENVFQTNPFQITASLLNPWGGEQIPDARLRLVFDAPDAMTADDMTASTGGGSLPFTADGNGDLTTWLGAEAGFPVAPGYNVSTPVDLTVADAAPTGAYGVTLQLVAASDPSTVLAEETGTITVNANAAMVLWGGSVAKYATQGTAVALPLQVYSPAAGTAHLTLTITGPGDDETTPDVVEALKAGDVRVYGSNGTDMVPMALSLDGEGRLVGTWDAALVAGYTPVTWYATVIEGAPAGNYAFGVELQGGNELSPAVVAISAPEEHGHQPPGSGEDTTAPVVAVTVSGDLGPTASFTISATDESDVTLECMLTTDGVDGAWEACTSPKTYADLQPGTYKFSARGTDEAGNVSTVVSSESWTVTPPPDTTPPTVSIAPIGVPSTTARFTLSADENATFRCQLTRNGQVVRAWANCTSPVSYYNLRPGTFVLSVRGTDTAGNTSQVTTYSWRVQDTTAPVVTVQPVISRTTARFTFRADEAATFQCRLLRGTTVVQSWARCTSPKSYTNLRVGSTYTFNVRATDTAGNTSSVVSYRWTVRR